MPYPPNDSHVDLTKTIVLILWSPMVFILTALGLIGLAGQALKKWRLRQRTAWPRMSGLRSRVRR